MTTMASLRLRDTDAWVFGRLNRAVGSGAAGAAQAAPLFMPIFFFVGVSTFACHGTTPHSSAACE